MFDFLQGYLLYPASEIIHALQGVLVGYLGARAIFKKEVSDSIIALLVTIAFATYEGFERWRILDNADQDLENFWLSAVGTGLLYTMIHFWRRYRHGQP